MAGYISSKSDTPVTQGTGLLRVYDSAQYFLESDTKITDSDQRTGARLVCICVEH